MKKLINKIKGFTLTELAIVIAVIAILIAVLVPSFISLINKAQESNDMVLVSNLNKSLSIAGEPDAVTIGTDSQGNDITVYNVTDAITSVRSDGYDISKLSPTADGGDIVYNASTNKFIYYANNFTELAYGDEPSADDVLVVVTDATLSRYGLAESSALTGANTIQYCVYSVENASISTTEETTIWLYTENITPTVDAANALVYHYGSGTYAYISDVAKDSYHLYGSFNTIIALGGHIDTTKGTVKNIYVPSEHADKVVVDKNTDTTIYSDDSTKTIKDSSQKEQEIILLSDAEDAEVTEIIEAIKETAQASYSDTVITEATCEEAGSIVYTSADGTTTKKVTIPATGHSYEIEYTNPKLTNGRIAYDLVYTCTECDANTDNHSKTETGVMDKDNFGWNLSNDTSVLVNYTGSLTDIVIPDGIKTISEQAFYKNSTITSVVIPDSVTEIGKETFAYCSSLKSVTIGSGDTDLSNGSVFSQCKALETIIISEGVTSISGTSFFAGCTSISYISIPDSIEYLGYYTFENSSLDINTNSPSVCWLSTTCIENPAPYNYNSEDKCYYIGNEKNPYVVLMAVLDKSITSFTVNEGTKIIGRYAFCGKVNSSGTIDSSSSVCESLTTVTFTDGLKCVGNRAFKGCTKLASVVIPDSVKLIDTYAFSGCSAITTVKIGDGVTEIGNYGFNGCTKISSLTLGNNLQTIGNYALNNVIVMQALLFLIVLLQ